MIAPEPVLVVAALLLAISVLASKAAGRTGIPALLLFLGIGMLAGSEGVGGIEFEDAALAQFLGVVALSFILFSGGLDTRWEAVRPVLGPGLALATVGVLVTALAVGSFAHLALGLPLLVAFLLGAIVSSTDAAAVFSVLRARSVGLKGRLKPLLELESGSNDPMAVFLTIGFIALLTDPSASWGGFALLFVRQMALGAAFGYLLGHGMVQLLNRIRLEHEGLYPVLTLAFVAFTYGATSYAGGNGFLAVYLAGIIMGNARFVLKRSLVRYHDGLAWLMQIAMFLTLGLLVFPSRLAPVAGSAVLLSAVLVLVARPLGTALCLLPFRMPLREITLVSWVGLRGAVPIILATFPLIAGVRQADLIFNIVFFVVLTSVVIQGPTLPIVARLLRVHAPVGRRRAAPLEFDPGEGMKSDLVEIEVPPGSPVAGLQLVQMGLPKNVLIVLLGRRDEFLVPRGGTIILEGDRLLTLADAEAVRAVRRRVGVPGTALE